MIYVTDLLALPPEYQATVEKGVDLLPLISLSCLEEADGTQSYVPVDPTQAVIMGLRIARQEGMRREFIDWGVARFEPRRVDFPDTFALRGLPMETFNAALLVSLKRPAAGSQHDKRARKQDAAWQRQKARILKS